MQFARDLDFAMASHFVSMYVNEALHSTTAPTAARPSASCSLWATSAGIIPIARKSTIVD